MPVFSFTGFNLMVLFRKPHNWQKIYKQTTSTFYTSNECLKRVEKKKLLGHQNKEISLNTFLKKKKKQPPEVLYKKTVVRKLAIITEKHLCWSSFLIENIAKSLRAAILKNICEQLLLKICSWNHMMKLRTNKTCSQGILTLY